MHFPRRPSAPRTVLAGVLLACLAIAATACRAGDPLDDIRQKQATGDFEGTLEPLRELLEERPDDAEANYLYGRALTATQQGGLATFALRKAMADPEWTVPAGLQLAYAALGTLDYNEVVEATTLVLEREPENVEALIARANAYAHWRKDPDKALADADRVLELDPDQVDALKPRILALLLLDRSEEAAAALADLGRRIESDDKVPERARAWHCATVAIFTEESGDAEKARELWKGCIEAHPAEADVVWPALRFYDAKGESERSIEVLRGAVAKDPAAAAYRTMLADRLRLEGKVADGEALLRGATESEDSAVAAGAWMDLGRYHRAAGDPAAAAEAMERGIALARETAPVQPQVMFEYAEALMLAKKFDRARELAEELTVPAHRHIILGRVAQETGDPAAALKAYDEAFRLWPDNPWARYYAARAAEDLGDFDRALEEYRSSIRIDPGATDARTRAARLLAAEGKPRFASQLLREFENKPMDLEGQRFALRLAGRFSSREEVDALLSHLVGRNPLLIGEAVAAAAEGVREGRGGPKAAVKLIRDVSSLDFREPLNAAALRALVRFSREAGERATPPELGAALAARPDASVFQEIRGLDLELSGAPAESAREAYSRAVELDPRNPHALAGLGRLALASDDAAGAVGFFDRASAADPTNPDPALRAARLVAASGRLDEAARRFDALLAAHPTSTEAAVASASLDLRRDQVTAQTLERARRAVRFGGGIEALELLERVHAERGEPEEAAKVAERARALREKGAQERPKAESAEPAG